MSSSPKVLRSFFVDQLADLEVARLAQQKGVSKNEAYRELLQQGLEVSKASRDTVTLHPGTELDERESPGRVLRTIYLDPAFDESMRRWAFEARCSKSELMRQFVAAGLRVLAHKELVKADLHWSGLIKKMPVRAVARDLLRPTNALYGGDMLHSAQALFTHAPSEEIEHQLSRIIQAHFSAHLTPGAPTPTRKRKGDKIKLSSLKGEPQG